MGFLEQTFLKWIGPWIERPPMFMRRSFLKGTFRIREDTGRMRVYLTFDDGPIPECTPWLLDELDRHGVKATFFVVGDNVRKYPELYAELLRRGHKVGNHTMHHLNGLTVWTTRYLKDIQEAAGYVQSTLLRPPHGWMRFAHRLYLSRKYRLVMYDLVTRDYSKYVDAQHVFENVKRYARSGSIIVFHDSLKSVDKLKTALPQSIEWLKEQGYEFGLIPDKNRDVDHYNNPDEL